MSLASIKEDTEAYIKNNWTETPIFYYPENISGNNAILLKFAQVDRELYSSGCGNVHSICFATLSSIIQIPRNLTVKISILFISLDICRDFIKFMISRVTRLLYQRNLFEISA